MRGALLPSGSGLAAAGRGRGSRGTHIDELHRAPRHQVRRRRRQRPRREQRDQLPRLLRLLRPADGLHQRPQALGGCAGRVRVEEREERRGRPRQLKQGFGHVRLGGGIVAAAMQGNGTARAASRRARGRSAGTRGHDVAAPLTLDPVRERRGRRVQPAVGAPLAKARHDAPRPARAPPPLRALARRRRRRRRRRRALLPPLRAVLLLLLRQLLRLLLRQLCLLLLLLSRAVMHMQTRPLGYPLGRRVDGLAELQQVSRSAAAARSARAAVPVAGGGANVPLLRRRWRGAAGARGVAAAAPLLQQHGSAGLGARGMTNTCARRRAQ